MEAFFTEAFMPLWALVLALALFFPVRQLIWVLYVRRAQHAGAPDEAERPRLKRGPVHLGPAVLRLRRPLHAAICSSRVRP